MNFLVKLWQCLFCLRVRPSSDNELEDSRVIIAQSFGLRQHDPGISNGALARVVDDMHERHHLPVILQWEIGDCLPDKFPKAGVIRKHRLEGKYLDTLEVLLQTSIICRRKGWEKIIVVAHPDHAWRVAVLARKLGFRVAVADTTAVPYDRESVQWWTRNRFSFAFYEFCLARPASLLRGWL